MYLPCRAGWACSIQSCPHVLRTIAPLALSYFSTDSRYKKCIAKPKKTSHAGIEPVLKKCSYKPKKFHVPDSNWGC